MKQVAGRLRGDLAQYRELAAFASFGSDLDKESKDSLSKGQRLVEILKQDQYKPMVVEDQIIILYAGTNNHLNDIPVPEIRRFEKEFLEYIHTHVVDIPKTIAEKKEMTDDTKAKLDDALNKFKAIFK
jgi:F-type H+/Na+-transporting ATPase subunit alpha